METQATLIGPRLAALQHEIETGNTSALADFWQEVEQRGTPLIEPVEGDEKYCLVSFICRAPDETTVVSVGGQISRHGHTQEPLTRMPDTDVLHRTYRMRSDLRTEYRLVFGDEEGPDPLNPKTMPFPPGEDSFHPKGLVVSVLELPAAPPQPWIKPRPGVAPGQMEQHRFPSTILDNERLLSVYTPAGYQPAGGPYPLVVLFDRWVYAEVLAAPTTLDNLIAVGAVPPLVAVMISHIDFERRDRELGSNADFVEFLAQELVPWVRQNYCVTTDPALTVAGGTAPTAIRLSRVVGAAKTSA